MEYRNGAFELRSGEKTVTVPAKDISAASQIAPAPDLGRTVFRKDAAYAVWDSRGLSIRKGKKILTTRLPEVAVSPKIFSREAILYTRLLVAFQVRSLAATGISGAKRVGSKVFFLLHWDDWTFKPWLEALVQVDLSSKSARPELLGRFQGVSLASGNDPNHLRLFLDAPSALTQLENGDWGFARFDPEDKQFSFSRLGAALGSISMHSNQVGHYIQKTPYGSKMLGRLNLNDLSTRLLAETRGSVRLIDKVSPWLAYRVEGGKTWLHNLDSGALLEITSDMGVARSPFGLIVWSPKAAPKEATLYDVERFEALARWSANVPPMNVGTLSKRWLAPFSCRFCQYHGDPARVGLSIRSEIRQLLGRS